MDPTCEPQSAETVADVFRRLRREPVRYLVRSWNWKAALTSSAVRGILFFSINATVSMTAAIAALLTEAALRGVTSGFYGALTQAFRFARPRHHAMLAVTILLPLASHGLELLVHWARGTERLLPSIAASMALTVVSTAFNLFAMQRGVLVVGGQGGSLASDLARVPGLLVDFAASGVAVAASAARRLVAPAGAEAR
jgi:hypothetical protein